MPAQFETIAWPLLKVRMVGEFSEQDIDQMLEGVRTQLLRGRCVVVFDTSEVVYPTLGEAQRYTRKEAAWLKQNTALVESSAIAVAFVITNPALRFVLSSILLVAPLPTEHVVLSDPEEASAWCRERLLAARR